MKVSDETFITLYAGEPNSPAELSTMYYNGVNMEENLYQRVARIPFKRVFDHLGISYTERNGSLVVQFDDGNTITVDIASNRFSGFGWRNGDTTNFVRWYRNISNAQAARYLEENLLPKSMSHEQYRDANRPKASVAPESNGNSSAEYDEYTIRDREGNEVGALKMKKTKSISEDCVLEEIKF